MASDIDRLQLVREILQKAIDIICETLDPKPLLLPMQAANALDQNDVTRIEKAGDTDSDKAQKLVDILTKKPASAYDVFMDTLYKKGRTDIYNAVAAFEKEVGYIRPGPAPPRPNPGPAPPRPNPDPTPPRPNPGAQKVSGMDILKVTQKAGLTPDNMDVIYQALEISEADVENGRLKAKTADAKLQASKILQGWVQKNGKAASRQVLLDAVDMCGVPDAVEFLKNEWKITS